MTQQTITGPSFLRVPSFNHALTYPIAASTATLDLGDEAVHFCGACFLQGRTGSKTISAAGSGKIWWLPSTTTFANGSTNLRVGIQDLDATGFPMRGDGTFDVYADLVGGTDTITTNTYLSTTMESGSKTINHGDKIAIAFTMTSRGGADSVLIKGGACIVGGSPGTTLVTAGPTYNGQTIIPNALIEFDDGSYGWIFGSFIVSTGAVFTTTNVGTGSTPDEYANIFRLPYPCNVDALYAGVGASAGAADFELILYSDPLGTPVVVEAISVEANHSQVTSSRIHDYPLTTVRSLSANTDYAVAVRPTAATTMGITTYDVSTAAHWIAHPLGTNCYIGKRSDQTGAFSPTDTQRMTAGVIISSGDDAGGGGGQRIIGG